MKYQNFACDNINYKIRSQNLASLLPYIGSETSIMVSDPSNSAREALLDVLRDDAAYVDIQAKTNRRVQRYLLRPRATKVDRMIAVLR